MDVGCNRGAHISLKFRYLRTFIGTVISHKPYPEVYSDLAQPVVGVTNPAGNLIILLASSHSNEQGYKYFVRSFPIKEGYSEDQGVYLVGFNWLRYLRLILLRPIVDSARRLEDLTKMNS